MDGQLTPVDLFDGDTIKCPECGHEYTHHKRVEVFARDGEDSDGLVISVFENDAGKVVVETRRDDMKTSPSTRRDGIRLLIQCEQCDAVSPLHIHQHKGNTFVGWPRKK